MMSGSCEGECPTYNDFVLEIESLNSQIDRLTKDRDAALETIVNMTDQIRELMKRVMELEK